MAAGFPHVLLTTTRSVVVRAMCLATVRFLLFVMLAACSLPCSSATTGPAFLSRASRHTPAREPEPQDREQQLADRYLMVVRRRPRFGTAFDRVYDWHVRQRTLDALITSLRESADDPDGDPVEAGRSRLLAGMLEFRRGNPDAAVTAFEAAAKQLPGDCGPLWYLGRTRFRKGELRHAADAFAAALERDPTPLEQIDILLELGRTFVRSGRMDDADGVWKQLEQRVTDPAQLTQLITDVLIEEGRHSDALQRLRNAADALDDPSRSVPFEIAAADVAVRLGRAEDAVAALERRLRDLSPSSDLYAAVRTTVDRILTRTQPPAARVTYYRDWCAEHPRDATAWQHLAAALRESGREAEAEQPLRNAVRLAPQQPEPRQALIDWLAANGRVPEAIAECAAAREQAPDDLALAEQQGRLWLRAPELTQEERRRRAAEIWTTFGERHRDDVIVVSRVAHLLQEIDFQEDALRWYRTAVRQDPGDPTHREALGEFLHALGRIEDARAVWLEIASGERRTADNLIALGHVLLRFDDPENAVAAAEDAARLDPQPDTQLRAARLLALAQAWGPALRQVSLAEDSVDDPLQQQELADERARILEQAVRATRGAGDYAAAVAWQRRLAEHRPDECPEAGARLLVEWATQLERDRHTAAACAIHLQALAASPAVFADDLESHAQTFEHARLLPQLADTLARTDLTAFRPHADLLLKIAASVHQEKPDNPVVERLVQAVLRAFPDDAPQLQDRAEGFGLPIPDAIPDPVQR